MPGKPKAKKPKDTPREQHGRFVRMAKEVEADESPDALDLAFGKLEVKKSVTFRKSPTSRG
jgi:hypothetical protein